MAKKKRLGRGLDALLSKPAAETVAVTTSPSVSETEGLLNIPVDLLQRGQYQPRVDMRQDTLEELAKSINAQGVVQPIVVRATVDNRYEIVAGERRWRATQLAGIGQIPAIIKQFNDQTAAVKNTKSCARTTTKMKSTEKNSLRVYAAIFS